MQSDSDNKEYITDLLSGFQPLVNKREIAIDIAESLLEHNYGGEALRLNLPLEVEEESDHWKVIGNCPKDFDLLDDLSSLACVNIGINKKDGAILWLIFGKK